MNNKKLCYAILSITELKSLLNYCIEKCIKNNRDYETLTLIFEIDNNPRLEVNKQKQLQLLSYD